jgi:hypothetical protein
LSCSSGDQCTGTQLPAALAVPSSPPPAAALACVHACRCHEMRPPPLTLSQPVCAVALSIRRGVRDWIVASRPKYVLGRCAIKVHRHTEMSHGKPIQVAKPIHREREAPNLDVQMQPVGSQRQIRALLQRDARRAHCAQRKSANNSSGVRCDAVRVAHVPDTVNSMPSCWSFSVDTPCTDAPV